MGCCVLPSLFCCVYSSQLLDIGAWICCSPSFSSIPAFVTIIRDVWQLMSYGSVNGGVCLVAAMVCFVTVCSLLLICIVARFDAVDIFVMGRVRHCCLFHVPKLDVNSVLAERLA